MKKINENSARAQIFGQTQMANPPGERTTTVELCPTATSSGDKWIGTVDAFFEYLAVHEEMPCTVADCAGRDCSYLNQPSPTGRPSNWYPIVDDAADLIEIQLSNLSETEFISVEERLAKYDHLTYTSHECRPDALYASIIVVLSRSVTREDFGRLAAALKDYLDLPDKGTWVNVGQNITVPTHPTGAQFAVDRVRGEPIDVTGLSLAAAMRDTANAAREAAREQLAKQDEEAAKIEDEPWRAELRISEKDGRPVKTSYNVIILLRAFLPNVFRWNAYAKRIEVVIHDDLSAEQHDLAERLSKASSEANIPIALQLFFYVKVDVTFEIETITNCIRHIADQNQHNPLLNYLNSRTWDNMSRAETFLIDCFGADDTPFNRLVSRRWLIGCVARAYEPGCKFDNVLIFECDQGFKKTSGVEALAGPFYASTEITLGDRDSKMAASAAWFIEMAELDSIKKASTSAMKAFLTTRKDFYRAPWGHGLISVPRTCVLFGTTNDEQYLTDSTGNRRFWPVHCAYADVPKILVEADQIWAEVVAIYKASLTCPNCTISTDTVYGQSPRCKDHRWWFDREEEDTAKEIVEEREETGAIHDLVEGWWYGLAADKRPARFQMVDVLKNALKLDEPDMTKMRGTEIAVGRVLAKMKFKRRKIRFGKVLKWFYEANEELLQAPVFAKNGVSLGRRVALASIPPEKNE